MITNPTNANLCALLTYYVVVSVVINAVQELVLLLRVHLFGIRFSLFSCQLQPDLARLWE